MKVDILIGVAEKGGVENIIKMMLPVLRRKYGWDIRVVQLVWEGYRWVDEEENFFPLLHGRKGHTLEEFVLAYADWLMKEGCPDVVLATAWPYMNYVSKKALAVVGNRQVKVISWLHAPVEKYKAAGFGSYEHLALADAHFAISQLIANDLESRLSDARVLRVYNPVNFDNCVVITAKQEMGVENIKRLYFIGRISEEKRLDIVIRAIGRNNGNWKLFIIGDGDEKLKKELKRLVLECNAKAYIEWIGWQEQPWNNVKNADALVLASEYEGFPLVAIEALINGIPVISTPVSGIVELISPGVNGYIFPKGDAETLALVLQMIYDGKMPTINPENCKKSVECFEAEEAIADFVHKIEEIL